MPGTNYAVAGATSALAAVGGPTGINLPEQVGAFSAFEHGAADPSALYVVMIGGNDVRNAALQATGPGAITDGVDTELAAISTLSGEGARNFLVVNVPDVGIIPEFAQDNPTLAGTATTLSQLYDTDLAAGLAFIDPTLAADVSIHQFDLYGFNVNLLANAASLGFTNTTDRCYTNTPLSAKTSAQCGPNAENIDSFVYWDDVHPTANVHALWAKGMEEAVPEPSTWAMLLIGFAAMGLAGYANSKKQEPLKVPTRLAGGGAPRIAARSDLMSAPAGGAPVEGTSHGQSLRSRPLPASGLPPDPSDGDRRIRGAVRTALRPVRRLAGAGDRLRRGRQSHQHGARRP